MLSDSKHLHALESNPWLDSRPFSYGEQGTIIIKAILDHIFLEPFDDKKIHPFTNQLFHSLILIPLVGIYLIRVDLSIGIQDAIKVMRKSTIYGQTFFSDDDNPEVDAIIKFNNHLRHKNMATIDERKPDAENKVCISSHSMLITHKVLW